MSSQAKRKNSRGRGRPRVRPFTSHHHYYSWPIRCRSSGEQPSHSQAPQALALEPENNIIFAAFAPYNDTADPNSDEINPQVYGIIEVTHHRAVLIDNAVENNDMGNLNNDVVENNYPVDQILFTESDDDAIDHC